PELEDGRLAVPHVSEAAADEREVVVAGEGDARREVDAAREPRLDLVDAAALDLGRPRARDDAQGVAHGLVGQRPRGGGGPRRAGGPGEEQEDGGGQGGESAREQRHERSSWRRRGRRPRRRRPEPLAQALLEPGAWPVARHVLLERLVERAIDGVPRL